MRISKILYLICLGFIFFPVYQAYAAASTWTQNTTAAFNYGKANNVTVAGDAFSLASEFISSQLASTAVNDVYVYDTTADSSAATQVTLGVDPNWRNGVVKTTGAINTTDSSNIQVSVPNNDYTNANNIELKITTGGTTGTATFQYRESDGDWSSDTTTSTSLTALGDLGVSVSFTSGATFTIDDVFTILSWYTEQLDATELTTCTITTMDRCGSRAFPKKSLLVATASNVYIVDVKNNTMWMRFNVQVDVNDIFRGVPSSNYIPLSVYALNGEIYVGTKKYSNDYGQLVLVNFITDTAKSIRGSGNGGIGTYNGNISQRHASLGYNGVKIVDLVAETINDVHAAVISGKTYVAVATDGGVSLINETDQSLVNVYPASNKATKSVFLTTNGNLYYTRGASTTTADTLVAYYTLPVASDTTEANKSASYTASTTPALVVSSSSYLREIKATVGTSDIDATGNTVYVATDEGLNILQENRSTVSDGSIKYMNISFISEEQIGDIRGMWSFDQAGIGNGDATIVNAEDVQDRSVKDTDMTVVDGGGTAPQLVDGVRGKAIQFDGSNDYLKQKVYEDQTGASFGPTYHGLSLANEAAFYRSQGVDLSPFHGTDGLSTPYMLVLKDATAKTAWGYMGSTDAAEALGSEKVTNGGFDTDTSSWTTNTTHNTIASVPGGQSGNCVEVTKLDSSPAYAYHWMNTLTVGKLYKLTAYVKSGTGGNEGFTMQTSPGSYITGTSSDSWTQYSFYFTATATSTSIYLAKSGGTVGTTILFDTASLKEVTDVGIDGVHIFSTKGGPTQSWAGIESGFNYNDTSYTFEVRKTDFQITGNLTVGAWVKRARNNTLEAIITKADQTGLYLLLRFGQDNTLYFRMTEINALALSPYSYTDTNWHHIIGVFDAGNSAKLYVDGQLVATDNSVGASISDTSYPFVIAGRYNNIVLDIPFSGTIDEPFVTAEALTATQILQMWRTGCRAMGGTPTEPGGGSPNTCDSIPGTHPTNNLAGSQNAVYGVAVDTVSDPDYAYVGTSGSSTGALSKIQVNADVLSSSWTTDSTLALPSNNVSGGVSVIGGVGEIGLGTDSGFSLLSPSYAAIGGLISGTSAGSGYGYDTESSITRYTSVSYTSTDRSSTTVRLRGADDEEMTTGLTPWYEITNGGDPPAALDNHRYIQYEAELINNSSPTFSSFTLDYDPGPSTPTNFSGIAPNSTSITWTWTDVSSDETGFRIYDSSNNLLKDLSANTTSWTEIGLTRGTTYTRYIVSYSTQGGSTYESDHSDEVSVTTKASKPQDVDSSPDKFRLVSPQGGAISANAVDDKDDFTGSDPVSLQGQTLKDQTKPLFIIAKAKDTDDGIDKYSLSFDTDKDGRWIIDNIPASGKYANHPGFGGIGGYHEVKGTDNPDESISDPSKVSYIIRYKGEEDNTDNSRTSQDPKLSNDTIEIEIRNKSISQSINNSTVQLWPLPEGERNVSLIAQDTAGNQKVVLPVIQVDNTSPSFDQLSVAGESLIDTLSSSLKSYATLNHSPGFAGRIIDPYKGVDLSGKGNNDGTNNYSQVSSGPKKVIITVDKQQQVFGQVSNIFSNLLTVEVNQDALTEISQDYSAGQPTQKTARFFYRLTQELDSGTYRISIKAKDKADNQSPTFSFYLTVYSSLDEIKKLPVYQQIVNEVAQDKVNSGEVKGLEEAKKQVEEKLDKLIKDEGIILPEELKKPSKVLDLLSSAYELIVKSWYQGVEGINKRVRYLSHLSIVGAEKIKLVAWQAGQARLLASNQLKAQSSKLKATTQNVKLLAETFNSSAIARASQSTEVISEIATPFGLAMTREIIQYQQTRMVMVEELGRLTANITQTGAKQIATTTNRSFLAIGDIALNTGSQLDNSLRRQAKTTSGATKSVLLTLSQGLESAGKIVIDTGDKASLTFSVILSETKGLAATGSVNISRSVRFLVNAGNNTISQSKAQSAKLKATTQSVKLLSSNQLNQINMAAKQASNKAIKTIQPFSHLAIQQFNQVQQATNQQINRFSLGINTTYLSLVQPASEEARNVWNRVKIANSTWTAIVFDKEPTRISQVKIAKVSSNEAVVTWKTNHYATSKVNYGFSTSYGEEVFSNERVKEHKMVLKNLEPGKTYYFEVMSQNKNYAYDAYYTFETPQE